MTTAHRFVSLSLLGGMALTLAPLASAQGFGGGAGFRGHVRFGGADLDVEARTEVRAELETCREENDGDKEGMKACAEAVFETYGIEKPERPERQDRPEIPEEARTELEDCREENDGDKEGMKACAEAVAETYGFDLPPQNGRGRGMKIGHRFRSSIEESCGEREDTDEWKECARDARSGAREDVQERRMNFRDQLQTCLELDDVNELRECVRGVRDEIREGLDN